VVVFLLVPVVVVVVVVVVVLVPGGRVLRVVDVKDEAGGPPRLECRVL
jgi:hypothetical protein